MPSFTKILFTVLLCCLAHEQSVCAESAKDTITVVAEGLADLNADTYRRDQGLALDAAREDARRQAVEKAVGTLVDSSTLVQNYVLISDKILTKTKGLIKEIKGERSWKGEDGFMHVEIQAVVFLTNIQDALQSMSREERISLLKERGNPKISVAVYIRDAARGGENHAERSGVAENILKEYIKKFGYRVQSEEQTEKIKAERIERSLIKNQAEQTIAFSHQANSDFSIFGEAKFEERQVTLQASKVTLKSYILTSWTVKCLDPRTGEELYFNNKIPRNKAWNNEDQAIQDIGTLIGLEFSKEFFEEYLMRGSFIYEVQVYGLPSIDWAELFQQEMTGLRPILAIELNDFSMDAISFYEIEFSGQRKNFISILNQSVIKPLNKKFGENAFKITDASGKVVRLSFNTRENPDILLEKLESTPPARVLAQDGQEQD